VILTTWEEPRSGWGWALPLPLPESYNPAADAEKILDDAQAAVREAHPNVAVRPVITEGHPAPVLERASRTADLLVLGCRGHGEFPGMLLGSVSEHCVTHAHCTVVVMHQSPPSGEHTSKADTEAAATS
jgi:nucleotide-binding universal stress UspA family protein